MKTLIFMFLLFVGLMLAWDHANDTDTVADALHSVESWIRLHV